METSKLLKILLVVLAVFVVYKVVTSKKQLTTAEPFDAVIEPEYYTEYYDEQGMDETGVPLEGSNAAEEFTAMDANETLPPGWAPTRRALPSPPPMSTAAQLLPKPKEPDSEDWGEYAPKALQGVNLLTADQYIGIDTQTSSLNLSSHDLRGYPVPNPRDRDVGPWVQSTYSADLMRKNLQ